MSFDTEFTTLSKTDTEHTNCFKIRDSPLLRPLATSEMTSIPLFLPLSLIPPFFTIDERWRSG